MDKDFYVSPFIDMDGHYTVTVREDGVGLRIGINERRGPSRCSPRAWYCARRPLTDRTLLRMLLRHPLIQPQDDRDDPLACAAAMAAGAPVPARDEAVARAQARTVRRARGVGARQRVARDPGRRRLTPGVATVASLER